MKTRKPLLLREQRAIETRIFEKAGQKLKPYLLEQTFTRSSYSNRYGGPSNENFEYIGDTVIGYYVVKKLSEHYGSLHSDKENMYYTFRAHEKDFTALKSKLVSNQTLAKIMDEWDLCQYLIVGKSDVDNHIDEQAKIKADLLEAIIGAIAVQVKWDQTIMEDVIGRILPIEEMIISYEKKQFRLPAFTLDNAVTTLKEWPEQGDCPFPEYTIIGPEKLGHDRDGNPKWQCECKVVDWEIRKIVIAGSKKLAKKSAAYLVLCERYGLANEYGSNEALLFWGWVDGKLIPNPPIDF